MPIPHPLRLATGPPTTAASSAVGLPADLTDLLVRARAGDGSASRQLFEAVYGELRRLARAQLGLRGRRHGTLETTALVHEAYLRLAAPASLAVEDRQHFFNLAARVMRYLLVDRVRRREAVKRGGGLVRVDIDDVEISDRVDRGYELLELERALVALESERPELARLVELRFFAGLPLAEIAPLLERSERSLKRDWRRARAFLLVELGVGRVEPVSP